ncbi:MAG: UbiA family prenyltransferase [Thermodesulfobacteriota bacterium]
MNPRAGTRVKAYLQLMRLPNVFTAIADIVAGYVIVRGFAGSIGELGALVLATSGIYAAGCVLNDCCDREIDARERPSRPLPSGRVSEREALLLACFLFAAGLFGACLAGPASFFLALAIVLLVIIYDTWSKRYPIAGPLNMAACRAGNLLLGMSPALAVSLSLIFPLVSFGYIFLVTRFSRLETEGNAAGQAWWMAGGIAAILLLFAALAGRGDIRADAFLYLALLACLVLPPLRRALRHNTPRAVQQSVRSLILAIPFLDAAYAAALQGAVAGLPAVFCLLPALLIARFFYVT